MRWKKCSKWHIIYSWLTYIAPHFRYGALIYYKLCQNSRHMDLHSAQFQTIERLYNSSVKQAFKLPQKGSKEVVNSFLNKFNMQNIVMRNYGNTAIK